MSNTDSWTLQVRTVEGERLAVVPYTSLMFSQELSGVGAASCTFNLDSEFLTDTSTLYSDLLEEIHVWEVYRNGILIYDWIPTNIEFNYLNSERSREAVVSGKGLAEVLTHGCVLPPKENESFITPTNSNSSAPLPWNLGDTSVYSYDGYNYGEANGEVPSMYHWVLMFRRVKERFAADTISSSSPLEFLTVPSPISSGSYVWQSIIGEGEGSKQQNGVNLLELLDECISTEVQQYLEANIGANFTLDWLMKPGGELVVSTEVGFDKSNEVIFSDSILYEKLRSVDRLDIKNYVITDSLDVDSYVPSVSLRTDETSRAKFGRRESYSTIDGDNLTRIEITGRSIVERYKDELSSWNLKVPSYVELPSGEIINRPFVSGLNNSIDPSTGKIKKEVGYAVGDWIGIYSEDSVDSSRSRVKLRVSAISCNISPEEGASVELTLQTNIQLLRELQSVTR